MRAGDLITLLGGHRAHLPVFLGSLPVTDIAVLGGRIHRSVMGDDFVEMPDRARDEVLTPSTARDDETGVLPILKVRDLLRHLAIHDADTEIFIDGHPVDGVETRRGRISTSREGHRFSANSVGGRDAVLAFTRWQELSDGTRHLVPF